MKLITDLNSLLAELQTWTHDEGSRDNKVAALKSFAKRAEKLLHGGDDGITIDFPKEDRDLRKLLCQAINQCLEDCGCHYQTTGRHFTVLDGKPESTGEEKAPSPPALVLLGPNRTADGREARVICNDSTSTAGQVLYLAANDRGNDCLHYTDAYGRFQGKEESKHDLVGHLPPEPVKPREFWVIDGSNSADRRAFGVQQMDHDSLPLPNQIHVREVLPDTRKQYHAWVRDDGQWMTNGDISESNALQMGYRKATLVELEP